MLTWALAWAAVRLKCEDALLGMVFTVIADIVIVLLITVALSK
jgi:hypothetical protein